MIYDIGVGIKGAAGSFASDVSDYSINEFQVLDKLLLEKGLDIYRKNA